MERWDSEESGSAVRNIAAEEGKRWVGKWQLNVRVANSKSQGLNRGG